MSEFVAQIKASLDAKQAQSDFNSFKSKIESEIINLRIKLDDPGKSSSFDIYFKDIQKQAQTAGQNAGKSFTTALQRQIETMARTQRNAFSQPLNNMTKGQKDYIDWWNKELAKQEKEQERIRNQELTQIKTAEESQKRIQVQQQIASLKANATQKNAHYNELVQQGKENLARLRQEYEDQSKYLQKYESFKTNLDNIKSSVSKNSSLLGASGYEKIYSQINKAEQAAQRFNTELQKGKDANFNNLTADLKEVNSLTQKATREYQKLTASVSAIDQQNFLKQLKKYETENPRAVKYGQSTWNSIMNFANSGNLTVGQFNDLKSQVKSFDLEMQIAGKTGKSLFQELQRGFRKIGEFAYTYGAIQKVQSALTSSINELKSIDTIITEISKAADVPVKQLKELGSNSFDVASKYGQKASDYLLGVQEMTRAGYSDTAGMAELSTLAQSAGDMTAELANQYLIASDMAFGYGGNVEKLNALLDSQNQITNRNAVNMTELANATKIVASQASQSGVAEDEMTAALSTMIATTQQGGEIAARAFKGILMNLQQVTGELDDGEVIDESSLQKVEKRLTSVGVAMKEVKNGTVSLRDPMQVLKELAQVYNSLPNDSVEKAGIISDLGGKYRGNQLAALLSNWNKYEKILGDYQNAQGSAAQEAAKTANSWEGSMNRLSNSWTDLVANFADSSAITSSINFLNSIVSGVDSLTESIGALNVIGAAGGFLAGKNGVG